MSIPIVVPGFDTSSLIPGVFSALDFTGAFNTSGTGRKLVAIGQRLGALISPAQFQGGGLNDAASAGAYTANIKNRYIVEISLADATDEFKWSKDNGKTFSASIPLDGTPQAIEEGITIQFTATTGHALATQWLIFAQPAGTVAKEVPTQVFNTNEALSFTGEGSILHNMLIAGFAVNSGLQLFFAALDDNGAGKSVGDLLFTGVAETSGSFQLWAKNILFEIFVTKGDTLTTLALRLQAKINEGISNPFFHAVNAATPAKIDLTAKNAGTLGDDITFVFKTTVTGLSMTITDMNGGAVDPDINDVLDNVLPADYNLYVSAYRDQTSLSDLSDHIETLSNAEKLRPATVVSGHKSNVATYTTLIATINDLRFLFVNYFGSRMTEYEIAMRTAGEIAEELTTDPSASATNLTIKGIDVVNLENEFDDNEKKSMLNNGGAYLEVGPGGGSVRLARAMSGIVLDSEANDVFLDIPTVWKADFARAAFVSAVSIFIGKNNTQFNRDEILSTYRVTASELETQNIIENADSLFDQWTIQTDPGNSTRIQKLTLIDVVDPLNQIANLIQLVG